MEYNNLQKTKHKLTITFTVLIFCTFALFGVLFLSSKYLHEANIDKDNFTNASNSVRNDFVSLSDFIKTFERNTILFSKVPKKNTSTPFFQEQQIRGEKAMNFLVIDESGNLVYQNIKDNIELNISSNVFDELEYNKVYKVREYYIKIARLASPIESYNIVFLKKQGYTLDEYMLDLIRLGIILTFFTIVFYFIGYTFVQKTLQPVEKNMADMQDFIHNAGHELKTPISIVHGNLQLMTQIGKFNKDLIKEGIHEIEKLDKLIEGLINLSNLNKENDVEKVSLRDEISEILNDFDHKISEKNIKIEYEMKKDKELLVNKEYLYIMISNLISNAIKYSKDGGTISINFQQDILSIQDNGIGIYKKNLENIFKRFFQESSGRESNGHGIGLSLVYKIVTMYNWKISVNSERGKGTEFKIIF